MTKAKETLLRCEVCGHKATKMGRYIDTDAKGEDFFLCNAHDFEDILNTRFEKQMLKKIMNKDE